MVAFAEKIPAAVGATRAAVDADMAPNAWQVGQTGQVVSADWYLAFGISGAIQHVAGILDCRRIVAINTDPDADIRAVSDYIIEGDWATVLAQLDRCLFQSSSQHEGVTS